MTSHDASQVSFYGSDGRNKSSFYSFSGVTDELKAFIHDISQVSVKVYAFLLYAY